MSNYIQLIETPVGSLMVTATETAVVRISWAKGLPLGFVEAPNALTQQAADELKSYFAGERQSFDFPIDFLEGTAFQKQVWTALQDIPYGDTVSYKYLAEKIGNAPRAVGGAVGENPLPIVVPCHRVVGENGRLTGYSGGEGIPTKVKLLEIEGRR